MQCFTKYCEPCRGHGWVIADAREHQCYRCGGTGKVLNCWGHGALVAIGAGLFYVCISGVL